MEEKDIGGKDLFVVVRIENAYYCVSSQYIADIIELPKYDHVSSAPYYITGMFTHRNNVVYMLDLRKLFGVKTLIEEYEEFQGMIDARKKDHINWVNELKHSLEEDLPFTLAINPHQCALGKWYDSFNCSNNVVKFHLKKIEAPHINLHKTAEEAAGCQRDCENCKREECLKKILKRAQEEYMPVILNLLEETKEIFKGTVYHEKILILNGQNPYGIVVDEVVTLESVESIESPQALYWCSDNTFVNGFRTSSKIEELILEINVPRIMELSLEGIKK